MRAKTGKTIAQQISRAYWPNPQLNESARREAGDAMVATLTIGQLEAFFNYCTIGPTYCMVKRCVNNILRKLDKQTQRKFSREGLMLCKDLFRSDLERMRKLTGVSMKKLRQLKDEAEKVLK